MKLIACAVSAALFLSLCAFASPAVPRGAYLRAQSQDLVAPVSSQIVPAQSQDPELSRHLRKYDLLKINPDAANREVQNRGRLVLKSSHGDFDLTFSPHDLRGPDYYAQEIGTDGIARRLPTAPVNTFKGTVKGDPRAQARMSLGVNGLEGAIITATEKYFIQPARALSRRAQSDEFVFYSAEDVAETDASCGVTLAEEIAAREELVAANAETGDTAELNNPVLPLSPMKIARIATDADAEYVNGLGGQTAAQQQILQTMNVVDGIYQVEIGVTFQISFQNFWSDQNTDPYTTTDSASLLTEFRNYWNANFAAQTRSLAHLWTGKDLDGSTIGIAFLAVVCRSPSGAYGLSQRFPFTGASDARTAILTAHEIGHNFSAFHTNVVTTTIPPEFSISCDNTIMESGLGSRTGSSFCALSRSQMVGHANAFGSCLLDSGNPPPANPCVETPITPQEPTNGLITNTDCGSPSRGRPNFADRYTFDATMGQQITITMNQASGNLDPYLYLIAPDGYVIDQAEFGSSGLNARIPETSSTGFITLPQTGRYIIEATSSLPGQTGGYQLTLIFNPCVLNATASAQQFPASGGTATVTVTPFGACGSYNIAADPATGGSSWILLSSGAGAGTQNFNVTVPANSNTTPRRSFILIGYSGFAGDTGGLRIPFTQSGTGPECSVTPIFVNQTLNGEITGGDCESPIRGAGLRTDRYTFTASAGQQVGFALLSGTLVDPFLTLIGPNGAVILTDDDGGGGQNARIPGGTGLLTLGVSGTYTVEASSLSANQFGTYTLLMAGSAPNWQPTVLTADQIEFKSWTVEGRTSVYVKLTFPHAGYRVNNWGTPVRVGNDFSVDALLERFNGTSPQAISNTAQIYDLGVLPTGNYTFTFKTSGTAIKNFGFSVGGAAPPPNPIDDAREFVRWQYKDFLRREPDGPGWDHWTNEITMCSDPANRFPGETEAKCIDRKRTNTSGAFFLSPEFQNTGYFVLRVYRGSLGRMPHFGGSGTASDEFTRDAATVSQGIVVNNALDPNVINANKQAFVNEFVTRPEFRAIYDSLNAREYVNKLFATTGVTPTASDRQALIDGLNAGTETRASVLFKVVDGTTTIDNEGHLVFNTTYGKAFYDNLFNAAFVQMEYFGYLLRDPDPDGYAFWLGKLNFFGNFIDAEMVRAFIVSPEYRSRFGAP